MEKEFHDDVDAYGGRFGREVHGECGSCKKPDLVKEEEMTRFEN